MEIVYLLVSYVVGAVGTRAATAEMGKANESTFYDSFTGSDGLDFWVCALWPAFWPLWLVHRVAAKAAKGK